MSGWKKLASAAAASGAALNVEDVFSTYLYDGNSGNQTITNGIDLSTEGGMVWIKDRTGTSYHALFDTERGANVRLIPSGTNAEYNLSDLSVNGLTAFNTDGFDLGSWTITNDAADDHVAWTFRKAPKFFDVVTYTGNGSSTNVINHNLGVVPGFIIIKNLSTSGYAWACQHKDLSTSYLELNNSNASQGGYLINPITSTTFNVLNNGSVNSNGDNYVAYLFAHNDGDGEFGPTGDQDIIKCGSFTTDGSGHIGNVSLGFEPQFILTKRVSNVQDWFMFDVMRGLSITDQQPLSPNNSNSETNFGSYPYIYPTADGFAGDENFFGGSQTVIYIAIRRGPMAVPTSGTDVFAIDTLGGTSPNPPAYNSSGWPVDMGIQHRLSSAFSHTTNARLIQGKFLKTESADAETANNQWAFDFQDGWRDSTAVSTDFIAHLWRRAPNFFDVVTYKGDGVAGRTVSHNLGVAPEMMWVKRRSATGNWIVYHIGTDATAPEDKYLILNGSDAAYDATTPWNDTAPTATEFTLGTFTQVNDNNQTYIAYLFASLDGISKVGSYTGNGTYPRNIDCGFTNGARFVLIKNASTTRDWYLWDTERGIVAGNDPHLTLNTSAAQDTSFDDIDPYSAGFSIAQGGTQSNNNGDNYIFYAIA